MSIILWILTTILDAVSTSNRKKSIEETNLSKTLFKYFAFVFGFVFIFLLIYLFWIEKLIFKDYLYLLFLAIIVIIWAGNTYLQLYVMKEVKLSQLMPYSNLDKLFTVIVWFFLYFWTTNWVSIFTLLISILTIIIVLVFSIDFKNISFPKPIIYYIIHKLIASLSILATSYILLKYSSITITTTRWFFQFILFSIIAIYLKENFSDLLKQTKGFYIHRWLATVLWRWSSFISLYVIQTAWVIIATLLWFFWIVFNILSMKIILKDNPTKKQIILAFLVILLIWIWYYFK